MDELLRFWAAPDPAGLLSLPTFPTVAFDPLAGAGGDAGAARSASRVGTVPKLEQIREGDPQRQSRQVRQGEKLSKLWNDLVDAGMLVQVGTRWVIDPTASPLWPGGDGLTGTFDQPGYYS